MHRLLSPLIVGQTRSAAGLALHFAVLFLPFVFVIWWLAAGGLNNLAGRPFVALALAGTVYLGSHCVRALRLAVMASRLLGISVRSSALLHLVTAPGAMIIPFKLGELLRLHQLWYLGRSFPGGLIILLLERFFDGLMILVLLGIVYAYHGPLGQMPMLLLAVTSLAILAGLVVFVLGPEIFHALQHYVVLNHRNPKSLRYLGQLDSLRQITTRGADL